MCVSTHIKTHKINCMRTYLRGFAVLFFSIWTLQSEAQQVEWGWISMDNNPNKAYLNDITYNPWDGSVYVSTPSGEIFKTEDDGQNWTELSTWIPDSMFATFDRIADIAFDPVTESVIAGEVSYSGGGVFITPNDGGGWSHECFYQSGGQTGGCTGGHITEVFFDGSNSIIMAGGNLSVNNGNAWVSTIGSAVQIYDYFQGDDEYAVVKFQGNLELIEWAGNTWQLTSQMPSYMLGAQDYVAEMDANDNLYLGLTPDDYQTNRGIYKSTNHGSSWTDISAGLPDSAIIDIALHPSIGQVFVATANAGVYTSTNGGAQWVAMNNGLSDVRINRIIRTNTGKLFCIGETGGFYYYNASSSSWEQRINGLNAAPQVNHVSYDPNEDLWVFNSENGVPYENTNATSNTWVPRTDGMDYTDFATRPNGMIRAHDGTYYVRAREHMYQYDHSSQQWSNITTNLNAGSGYYLQQAAAVDDLSAFAFYYNVSTPKVYTTENAGNAWQEVAILTDHSVYDMEAISKSKCLFISRQLSYDSTFTPVLNYWLVKVENEGFGWDTTLVQAPIPNTILNLYPSPAIERAPNGDIHIVVHGTEIWTFDFDTEVLQQVNGGNWPSQFVYAQIPALGIDDSNHLWFSFPQNGVFHTADSGSNWTKRSVGYDTLEYTIQQFFYDSAGTGQGILPSGFHYWGLDSVQIPVDTSDTGNNDTIPDDPNDPTGWTTIVEEEPQWKHVSGTNTLQVTTGRPLTGARLEAIDLLGRPVMTKTLGTIPAGSSQLTVPALRGLHGKGVMLLRLQSPDCACGVQKTWF